MGSTTLFGPEANAKSRIDRYGWKMVDSPGRFALVHKDRIEIDHTYQRDTIKIATISHVRQNFMWAAFGALSLAERADGSLYCIDGQHRVLAALSRDDIDKLPCMIFKVASVADEAAAFVGANTKRGPVGALDRFKAALVAGEPLAVRVAALAESHNIEIVDTGKPGTVRCIGSLLRLAALDFETLEVVFPLVASLTPDRPLPDRLLEAFHYLHRQEANLFNPAIRTRLNRLGADGLMRAAAEASAFYKSGGPKVWAYGIAREVNKGARTHRLETPAPDAT